MIELKNVSKYYHNGETTNLGLHNISLRFERNEIVAITGDSGSGKSTLLNVITKIDTFDEGEIYYLGNETSYFSISDMDDFRKNKIGFIFQNYNIIDSYTVLENVMLPLTLKGITGAEAKEKAIKLIERVGLSDRIHSRGTKLSGGEKQRCVIARALASDCEILACDEPTGNLDSKTGAEIIELIKEVAQDKLVLIVTHNFDQVANIVTRKIRVTDGEITEDEVYTPKEQDQDSELDLDYVPLKKKVCVKVAKNNVFFTPRKTILLSLIFIAICIATLFMFQAISSSFLGLETSPIYVNASRDRLVAYSLDHTAIDEAKLKGYDYDKNAFAEDTRCYAYLELEYSYSSSCYYSTRYSYKLKYGNEPKKDNEVVVITDKSSYLGYALDETAIGKKISIGDSDKSFYISGIAFEDVPEAVLTGCDQLRKEMLRTIIANNVKVLVDGNAEMCFKATDPINGQSRIILPLEYKGLNITIEMFDLYDITSSLDIEYSSEANSPVFIYNGSFDPDSLPLFEASIYTSTPKQTQAKLQRLDISSDRCSTETNANELSLLIQNLLSYLIMILASTALIIIFIITYVVLSRVYSSKKKDYEILRTLGITKKDMKHIVNYEVLGIGIGCMILSYIVFMILLYTVPSLRDLGSMQIGTTLIYFAVTLLFSYGIARRFNRKLFKFSVTKSMKGDGKHD